MQLQPAAAGEIRYAAVAYDKGVYTLEIVADINADGQAVHAIVTDYEQLETLTDILLEASLLSATEANPTKRLDLLARACFFIFCFRIKAVSAVEEDGVVGVSTTIIPGQSDFRSGRISWKIVPGTAGHCSMHVTGNFEPDFWIPPIIGPLLIKQKIIREAGAVLRNIELRIAHE
jgi:hypothetical protein